MAKSKTQKYPQGETDNGLRPGDTLDLHGVGITVIENIGGVVQFDYANGQRRALPEKMIEVYQKNGAFPPGAIFERLPDGNLFQVKVLSIGDSKYTVDIINAGDNFDAVLNLDTHLKFADLIKWHMEPDVIETSEQEFVPAEHVKPYIETAANATKYEAEAKAEVKRLQAEIDELTQQLAGERAMREQSDRNRKAAEDVARVATARAAALRNPAYKYEWNGDDKATNIPIKRQSGWEPFHFQFSADNCKLGIVYRKPVLDDLTPSPKETGAEAEHDDEQPASGFTIMPTFPPQPPISIPLTVNRRSANEVIAAANQEVIDDMITAMDERVKFHQSRPPVTLGGRYVPQTQ